MSNYEVFSSSDDRQKETKELLVSFALYIDGYKLSKDLSPQRSYLRSSYDKISASSSRSRRRFIAAIADMSEFRRNYWDKDGIEKLAVFHTLLTLGTFVSLYLSHRRIWFILMPLPGEKTRVVFGGRSNRNREGLEKEFESIKDTLDELS